MGLNRNVRGGKPSPYPRILFHALRSAQLLGAMVVSAIMAYFIYHLKTDGDYPISWTFILLLSVSVATIIALLVTIILYNFTYLSPRFNLILNGSISVGWGLGLGLLTWSIAGSRVLQVSCTAARFQNEDGAAVCREYKALWALTLCGTVSTVLAFLLDIKTWRAETRLGLYAKPEDDQATEKLRELKTMQVRSQGYEVPEEQLDHHGPAWRAPDEDISYRSSFAHEPRGPLDKRSVDLGYRDN